jgi:lipid II:glycine glycyltransferase (peptidoglycan interpeptide bridge formation enzyme)
MPPLTPYLGPVIGYPEGQKYTNRLSHEKKVLTQLIEQLPPFDYFVQYFPPDFTNWLPFYWKGFSQTTRYTYRFDDLSDLDKIWQGMRGNIRREIRKAQKNVNVKSNIELPTFYQLQQRNFAEKGESLPFDYPYLERIDDVSKKNKCRKTFYAVDQSQNIHAAVYIVWDQHTAYYLMGATHPKYKSSGAMSLVMWQAIQFAAQKVNRFDFEGSMIAPIERYFRAFGARQTPYFEIKKINSPILKWKEQLWG